MAPTSSSSARRQVRCCTNTGAKVRMREAKQAGRCMAASLGGDVPVYRSPAPPPRPRRALRRCHACPEWPKSSSPAPIQKGPTLLLPVAWVLPPQHLARVQQPLRVGLALEGELGVVDALHAAFLERVGVRVEDRAALLLVVGDNGGQALVAGVAHE